MIQPASHQADVAFLSFLHLTTTTTHPDYPTMEDFNMPLDPQSSQRRRRACVANNRRVECDKIKKRSNKPNSKNKRQPEQPEQPEQAKKRHLKITALSPSSSKRLSDPPPHSPSQQVDSHTAHNSDPPELQLPPPLYPLTRSNLRAHTQYTNPGEQIIGTMNNTDASTKASVAELERQLHDYGIRIDSETSLPPELDKFIREVVEANRPGPYSPAAKHLARNAPAAQLLDEIAAMELLSPHLMFRNCHAENGDEFNTTYPEALFHAAYVTSPDDPDFALPQPKPDQTNGYITRAVALTYKDENLRLPFSEEEENKLLSDTSNPPIHKHVLCPCYTLQGKSSKVGLRLATLQCGRDGVAVNEYMHRLWQRAGLTPTVVESCHWSMACDTLQIVLYVHWRAVGEDGKVKYHMQEVYGTRLQPFRKHDNENDQVVGIRKGLRNLLHYVQNDRLMRIKQVLKLIPKPPARSGNKVSGICTKRMHASRSVRVSCIPSSHHVIETYTDFVPTHFQCNQQTSASSLRR